MSHLRRVASSVEVVGANARRVSESETEQPSNVYSNNYSAQLPYLTTENRLTEEENNEGFVNMYVCNNMYLQYIVPLSSSLLFL